MNLEHCKRSKFDDRDDIKGAEAEDWVYSHLLTILDESDIQWNNKCGRSYQIDFELFEGKFLLEVERKAAKHWWLGERYGFTFLAKKCHDYLGWDKDVTYMLVKGDRTAYVYATVVELMLYGRPVYNETRRGREWFYKVPATRLRRGRLAW